MAISLRLTAGIELAALNAKMAAQEAVLEFMMDGVTKIRTVQSR
jgi:hypothetical protein